MTVCVVMEVWSAYLSVKAWQAHFVCNIIDKVAKCRRCNFRMGRVSNVLKLCFVFAL